MLRRIALWTCFIVVPAIFPDSRLLAATAINLPCTADTGLFQQFPNNNLGAMTIVPIGRSGSGTIGRGLYKFDTTEIAPGTRVVSATLELSVVFRGFTTDSHSVHRVLRDWGEGDKAAGPFPGTVGALAEDGEATWQARFVPAALWAAPGGGAGIDYVADASASQSIGGPERYSFSSEGLVADVQAWIDNPGTNYGWLLKIDDELAFGTARRFATREDSANAPALLVELEEEGGPEIESPQVAGANFQFQFQAEADKTYAVEYSDDITQTMWNILTNLPGATSGTAIITDPLGTGNRFYRIAQQ